MSAIVILVYLSFLAIILVEKTSKAFFALVMGTIFFPCCALFMESPTVSGQIVLLYVFLIRHALAQPNETSDAFKGPMTIYLLIVIASYFATTALNFTPQNAYYAVRDIVDLYGYFLAALIASKTLSWEELAQKMYIFVLIMCFYGMLEAATHTNLLYKYINLAFPAHDGWYNLEGNINASESFRIRTIITTKHPTTLGNLLMILFLFYWCAYQKKIVPFAKSILVLFVLGINVFLSGSRTSLACVAIALLYSYMKTKGIVLKIIVIGALLFSASYMVNYAIEHFMDSKDGSSIMLRMNQLAFSFEKIKDSPIWGNGSNYTAHQIKDEGVRFDDDDEFIGGLESVAFIYMIDRGLFGVLGFYLFWVAMFVYLVKREKNSENANVTLEILPLGIIMFLTMSGLIGNNTSFCFLFSGLIVGNIHYKGQESEDGDLIENISDDE